MKFKSLCLKAVEKLKFVDREGETPYCDGLLLPRRKHLRYSTLIGYKKDYRKVMLHTMLKSCSIKALRHSRQIISLRLCSSGIDFLKLISNNKVVVFMKGVPEKPRCGFSHRVCQILQMHGVEFDAHDVLQSLELREGIKNFTNWPTIPQVFMNGEFVGGCDILFDKHRSGELIKDLDRIGIKSALLNKKNSK